MYDIFTQVLLKDILVQIRRSPFIGIGMDESTDRSSEKHVVFIVQFLSKDTMKTTYLKIKAIKDGKADTVYSTMRGVLEEYNIPLKKVIVLQY